MITLTYKSKSTLAQSCGWSARHSSHCQNLPRGLRRKFKYPTFLSRAWLRLPDHSRSHIGPNAGGSLNLSNWTMELIQLSRSKFYNAKIILNIFNKYHSCLIWMSKQFWMMRPESWLNRKKCRFSHCLQIRGKDGDLSTFLMSSSVWISGLSPPWTQRNCWFIRAARGRQSKASMQASYTRSVYLILPKQILSRGWDAKGHRSTLLTIRIQDSHSCLNVKYSVRWRHSWFPLQENVFLLFWNKTLNGYKGSSTYYVITFLGPRGPLRTRAG